MSARSVQKWLEKHWVAGALFMTAALLALVPLIAQAWWPSLLLLYLHSPVYMLHQVEEHAGDRFRIFINQRLFQGLEALTPGAVLWINVPGVWGINLIALYAAYFWAPGYALAAPYLMLVNATAHFTTAFRFRGYNPGLWTSLVAFVPLAFATLWCVPASASQHEMGLSVALAIYLWIAGSIARRAMLRARET